MQSPKTHFEQVPLEAVMEIVEVQFRQDESRELIAPLKRAPGLVSSPTSMLPTPGPGGCNANDRQKSTDFFKSKAKNKVERT